MGGGAAVRRPAGRLREGALVAAQAADPVLGPQQGRPVGVQEVVFELPPVGPGLARLVVDIVELEHRGSGGRGGRRRGDGLRHEPPLPVMGEG